MTFDRDAFMNLIEGDKELAATLLNLFVQDWPNTLNLMDQALTNGRSQELERHAHRLKGSVRNFFAASPASTAEEIEQASREGNLKDLKPKIELFRTQLVTLQAELQSFIDGL